MSWQLPGPRDCYGVFVAVTRCTSRSLSREIALRGSCGTDLREGVTISETFICFHFEDERQ